MVPDRYPIKAPSRAGLLRFLICSNLGFGSFYPGDDIFDDLFLDAVEAVKVRRVARFADVVAVAVPGDLYRPRTGQL